MSTENTSNDLIRIKPRADGVRNKQRILAAAVDLFNSKGISVSLEEIAQRAQVGIGTVYRHFPNKQALFESVVQQSIQSLTSAARALTNREDSGEALLEFMLIVGHAARLKRSLIRALTRSGEDVAYVLRETVEEFESHFGNLVRRAQNQEAIRDDITLAELRALMAGCVLAQDHDPTVTDIGRLVRIIYDGIRA